MQLVRLPQTDYGTFGVLIADGIPFAVTVERRWNGNRSGESCIPPGRYKAVRCRRSAEYGYADSPKFGDTFVIEDVHGRNQILFHRGNIDDDTHGCIIVGEQFDRLNGEPAVLASAKGFGEFLALTLGAGIEEFDFEVRWAQ